MPRILKIPNLGSAEELVILVAWDSKVGAVVSQGEVIATVETKKAAFEMEADAELVVLAQLAKVGDELVQGANYAVVAAPHEETTDELVAELIAQEMERPQTTPDPEPKLTESSADPDEAEVSKRTKVVPMAKRLAQKRGLDLGLVTGSGPGGTITVKDIEQASVELKSPSHNPSGCLDPEFLNLIRSDRKAFGALSSALKLSLYRRFGAIIGADVYLSHGSIILCEQVVLSAGVFLGADVVCEGKTLAIGRVSYVGDRSSLKASTIHIGENAYFVRDVEVGGGGWRDPQSFVTVGDDGFIGENVHLNSCRGVTIGDEVTVSRNVDIMTHSYAQSEMDGYPTVFAPVVIEDNAQIGISCTLFPGSVVEKGAVVLSNSSVIGHVDKGRMFGGVPAKDMKAACRPMNEESRRRVAEDILESFLELVRGHGKSVEELGVSGDLGQRTWVFEAENSPALLLLREGAGVFDIPRGDGLDHAEIVLVQIDGMPTSIPDHRACTSIGLRQRQIDGEGRVLAASFREHLRKRGIRLRPGGWTYPGGWI